MFALIKSLLARLMKKLVSALIFVALIAAWVFTLSLLFTVSGFRARFYGADDIWIIAMTIIFLVLMVPVFIVHDLIMKKIHLRLQADASA